MYFTKEPWVNITLNGIPGAVASAVTSAAHLMVIAPERKPGERYMAFFEKALPTEDDQSEFAQLYRVLQVFVERGDLKGPFGEDHPVVYARFEYPSPTLSVTALLEALEKEGVAISVTKVTYSGPMSAEYGTIQTTLDRMRSEATELVGKWMMSATEFDLPEIHEKPKPKTPEEEAAWRARLHEELNRKPKARERVLEVATMPLWLGFAGINWLLTRRYRK